MRWFKHYSNASTSLKLQKLRDRKRGKEAYCEYWLLLELLCEKFDGIETKIQLSWKEVGTKLEVRSNRVGTILELYASLNLIEFNSVGTELEINAPILLELKDKDFSRTRKEREEIAKDTRTKSAKNKNKNKNKEEDKEKEEEEEINLFDHDFVREQTATVKTKTQESWIKLYGDKKWITDELIKAVAWISNNPNRAPKKNFGQFFSSWLSRSWESYRKTNINPPKKENHYQRLNQNNPFLAVANE